jgi:hypothetical protein
VAIWRFAPLRRDATKNGIPQQEREQMGMSSPARQASEKSAMSRWSWFRSLVYNEIGIWSAQQ